MKFKIQKITRTNIEISIASDFIVFITYVCINAQS